MANHALPTLTSNYGDFLTNFKDRIDDACKGFDPAFTSASNLPNNTIRWNSSTSKFEKFNGTAWVALTSLYNIKVGTANHLNGGNNTNLLGAIPYQSNTDTTSFVAPNTTTTKKFFSQTGNGTNGAIPAWTTLSASDVGLGNVTNESKSTMFTNPNFTGTASGNFSGNLTGNAATATSAGKLNPLSGDSNFKLAYTADGQRTNAGEWGRAVMRYEPNGQTYGIRVDRADYADSAGTAGTAGRAYPYRSDGGALNFNWIGQGGQPTWLWGGSDGTNMYVYNPSNFSVNYANTCWRANDLGNHQWDSKSTNGYIRLSTGLIIQWGEIHIQISGHVNWPTTFPNVCVQATVSQGYAGNTSTDALASVYNLSTSGADIQNGQNTGGIMRYIAIGW